MKHIVFFDIEGTGLNPAVDRIVQLVAYRYRITDSGLVGESAINRLFNPGFEMTQEVIDIHGISNEEAAKAGRFEDAADKVFKMFNAVPLGGFNLMNYDIPMLWEEFYRAGINWNLDGIPIVDVGNIFKKKEERTLAAAMKFYLNLERDAENHDAGEDTIHTAGVFEAMLRKYDMGKMSLEDVAKFSQFDDRVDLAGKIIRNDKGEPVYAIGKSRGIRVVDDPGFGFWMLDKDFPTQTKQVLRKLLDVE